MSSSVSGAQKEKLQKLTNDVKEGKWSEVFETFRQERTLRTAKIITGTGDTVLHMAVSHGEEKTVSKIVDFLVEEQQSLPQSDVVVTGGGVQEESWRMNAVLGAENLKKNTPLHLAASMGNVEMCRKIGGSDRSLIARRNNAGETPVFLAAQNGRKEAFLWLHHLYRESPGISSADVADCIKDDNNKTILHCAIAEGHADVAIEIVYLYRDHLKDMTIMRNGNGLSPLHLLAADRSAFKSTALFELLILAHPIYRFLKVENKAKATTKRELEQRQREPYVWVLRRALHDKCLGFFGVKKKQATETEESEQRKLDPLVWTIMCAMLKKYIFNRDAGSSSSWAATIGIIIVFLLFLLLLAVPLFILEQLRGCLEHPHNLFSEVILTQFEKRHSHILFSDYVKSLFKSCTQTHTMCFSRTLDLPDTKNEGEASMVSSNIGKTSSACFHRICQKHFLQLPRKQEKTTAGSAIVVDTPLMIAAKNGVTEMVEKILKSHPTRKVKVENEEGKNTVLLAAQKRQTKVYQLLWEHEILKRSVFSQVDKDGNTALHLAAKFGVNLNWQATTMVEEFRWFEYVKNSVPYELWEKYNKDGKTAEEIFIESHKEQMKSERKWLNQTSQACSVVSTLIAWMAFSFVTDNLDGNDYYFSSLVSLSLSLISTISFLAILAFGSKSLHFWRYVHLMLLLAIFAMLGSIVSLSISLMLHGRSLATYTVLVSPITFLTIVPLPIVIGPTLMSLFVKVPAPSRRTTSAIRYQRPPKSGNGADHQLPS